MHTFRSAAVIATALLTGHLSVAHAKSACNQFDQASCASQQSCRWIAPYKRTDGKEVQGYCRSAPAQGGQAVPGASPAAAAATPPTAARS